MPQEHQNDLHSVAPSDVTFSMRGAARKRALGNYNIYLVNKSHQDVKLINSNRIKRNNETVTTFADASLVSTQTPLLAAPVLDTLQLWGYDLPYYTFTNDHTISNLPLLYPYY